MLVIPAIDIKNGCCVRLLQGRADKETVYSDDPVSVLSKWVASGAQRVHIVDLDGAFSGAPVNFKLITEMRTAFPDVIIEVGGGIRTLESVERYIQEGIDRLILGTSIIEELEFVKTLTERFPGKIIAGLDSKDGFIATKGWTELTDMELITAALEVEHAGIKEIIATDISVDGMLSGPNCEIIDRLCSSVNAEIIASGGISSLDDLKKLKSLGKENLLGAITGKAVYSGNIDLKEAIYIIEKE